LGDITKVGTPANNQVGVWTGDGTLEGDANLTWDGTQTFTVNSTASLEGTRIDLTNSAALGGLYLAAEADAAIFFDDGDQLFITPSSDVANATGVLSGTQGLVVDGATGYVGIGGKSAIDEILSVFGNIKVTGTVDGRDVAADGALAASALQDLVDDTTPTLGGPLDCGANSIGFTAQSATGDGTTTITWDNGNVFNFTFGAFNETFTFTAPTKPGDFIIKLVQDGVGSRTATWPATVKWPGGTAPTLSTAAGAIDLIRFYFDGTNYYGTFDLNFS